MRNTFVKILITVCTNEILLCKVCRLLVCFVYKKGSKFFLKYAKMFVEKLFLSLKFPQIHNHKTFTATKNLSRAMTAILYR